ncbi:MAG TPA: YicC family protein [Fibrobacteria bacterium]|nr:YicC family protein [Fibrobacteria bacterium]
MTNIRSMTGFGTASATSGTRTVRLEVRSVNGRFMELQIRLPRALQSHEFALREVIQGKVGRGSVTVQCTLETSGEGQAGGVDWAKLAEELRDIRKAAGISDELLLSDLLRWAATRKVEDIPEPNDPALKDALLVAAADALLEHDTFRQREGAALEADLLARLDRIEQAAGKIPSLARATLEKVRESLETRIREYLDGKEFDEARVAQEIGHMSERLDVQEEMTRLSTHIAAFRKTLSDGGAVGKRIGFLLQEMLRETNTTGSKCQDAAITSLVISMKEDLEAIREQALNLE